MPWYEIALLLVGGSGGCFVPGIYAKLKAWVAKLVNE